MKKNIAISITTAVIILTLFILVGTGFNKRMDVELFDYSVSDNGKEMTLKIFIPSSMGYTRGFNDVGGIEKPHYLTFYSTFGGFNSSFGAKSEFILEIDEDDSEIYFNRRDGGYELVLQKNVETGEWIKP